MTSPRSITLTAPLSGPLVELEKVPDPVFAQKMVGDGVSIDPISNILVAPCAGTVTQVHGSQHAVTIRTEHDVEIMMHIGIDTVSLKGEGFTPKVSEGDTVKTNDPLIEFDMDYIAVNAKSLLTQIVVTNSEKVSFDRNSGNVTAGKEYILKLNLIDSDSDSEDDMSAFTPILSDAITIANPVGLHARPSAVLANSAKKFSSAIEIVCGSKKANAKSTTAVMKMEVANGESVVITAQGSDAQEAIDELTAQICDGLGEDVVSSDASAECFEEKNENAAPLSVDPNKLTGIAASPGIAIGNVLKLQKEVLVVDEYGSDNPLSEHEILKNSLANVVQKLKGLINASESDDSEIFEAHIELLDDPELLEMARAEIEKGKSAAYAWQKAYTKQADSLAGLKSELLAARATDMRDIGEQTLKDILGLEVKAIQMPENTILIAEDLTPSQTAQLDRKRVLGFCTVLGGASSHVAILARSLDIPAIAGIERRALEIEDGASIILDGTTGTAELNANDARINEVKEQQIQLDKKRTEDLANCEKPATTTDGHTVTVVGNAGDLAEVEQSVAKGGEGIGLLRSEFLFQNRASAPTEEEQAEVYGSMAKTLGNNPIVIRTLDVGGDKPLPYLPIAKEENPFLGERGIRVCLDRPEILRMQFRAILKASSQGTIEIMFPMISSLAEFRQAKAILVEEAEAMKAKLEEAGGVVEVK